MRFCVEAEVLFQSLTTFPFKKLTCNLSIPVELNFPAIHTHWWCEVRKEVAMNTLRKFAREIHILEHLVRSECKAWKCPSSCLLHNSRKEWWASSSIAVNTVFWMNRKNFLNRKKGNLARSTKFHYIAKTVWTKRLDFAAAVSHTWDVYEWTHTWNRGACLS